MNYKVSSTKFFFVALWLCVATTLLAQDAPSGGGGGSATPTPSTNSAGGGRGSFGGFDPNQIRDMMLQRIKDELKASDDEWTVIQPLLQTVMDKQRDSQMDRFSGMSSFMGSMFRSRSSHSDDASKSSTTAPSGDSGKKDDSKSDRKDRGDRSDRASRYSQMQMTSTPESDGLKKALESEETTNDELNEKLNALRDSREKRVDELKRSREDLRKVLTVRQEAQLVMMGILE
jgi:hypothetical protein